VAKRLTFAEQLLQRLDAKIDALTQAREELLAEIETIKAAKAKTRGPAAVAKVG
jgi:prefoldin subunit 5